MLLAACATPRECLTPESFPNVEDAYLRVLGGELVLCESYRCFHLDGGIYP